MFARAGTDLPNPTVDPDRVRAATHQILRRPEFRPKQESWLARAWNWIVNELAKLLARLFGGTGGANTGVSSALVIVVIAVAAALLLWLVVRSLHRGRRGRVAKSSPELSVRGDEPRRTAADWRAAAARHAAAGRYREALRCRYRALVADLAGRGVVVEIPGHTSGEYLHDVETAAPSMGPPFGHATELFELVWYGGQPAGAEDQGRFDDLASQVLSAKADPSTGNHRPTAAAGALP